nr:hypothetical protein 17 [bacterium]
MAPNFDTFINLSVRVEKALKDIERVERRLAKIENTSLDLEVKATALRRAERSAGAIANSFVTASKGARVLSTVLKGFAAGFTEGFFDPLALAAGVSGFNARLKDTSGFVRDIVGEADRLDKIFARLQRRNSITEKAFSSTTGNLDLRLDNLRRVLAQVPTENRETLLKITQRIVDLEERRSIILRQQQQIYDEITSSQRAQEALVRRNVRASRESRAGSGFAAFSQDATARRSTGGLDPNSAQRELRRIKDELLPAYIDALDEVKRVENANNLQVHKNKLKQVEEEERAKIEASKRVTAKDIAFKAAVEDFDRRLDARIRRRKKIDESNKKFGRAGVGAGFPLLFGGGPLSILGGGVGEIFGNFGGVIGSALGGVLDDIIASSIEFARALGDVEKSFDVLAEKSLTVSRAREREIRGLQEIGLGIEAGIQAQQDYARLVGADVVRETKEAGKAFEELARSFALFTESSGVARFLKGPAENLSEFFKDEQLINRIGTLKRNNLPEIGREQANELTKLQLELSFPTRPGRTKEKIRSEILKLIDEIEKSIPGLKFKAEIDPESVQGLKRQLQEVQLGLSVLQIAQSSAELAKNYEKGARAIQQADTRRKRATDSVKSAEKSIADLRLRVEERIADIRFDNQRKIAEIENAQDRLRTAKLRNDLQAARNLAKASNPFGDDISRQFQEALDNYQVRLSEINDQERADERNFALQQLELQIKTEREIARLKKQAADIDLRVGRAVARINNETINKRRQVSKDEFELQKQIDLQKLTSNKIQLEILRQQLLAVKPLSEEFKKYFQEAIKQIDKAKKDITEATFESVTSGSAGSVTGTGVLGNIDTSLNTAGIDAATKSAGALLDKLQQIRGLQTEEERRAARKALVDSVLGEREKNSVLEERLELLKRTAFEQGALDLGFKEEDISAIASGLQAFNEEAKTAETRIKNINSVIENADKLGLAAEEVNTLRVALVGLQDRLKALQDGAPQRAFLETFEKFDPFKDTLIEIADILGNSVANALELLVSGTDNLAEAMQNLAAETLKAVGQLLILKAVEAGVNALTSSFTQSPQKGSQFIDFGEGGGLNVVKNNGRVMFAEGGYVTRPTNALIGEGGEPEYVIPASKMAGAMRRYSAGATGSAVIDGPDSRGSSGGPISVNYNVTDINGMRFVTEDQFREGVALAAKQGADGGFKRTMTSLKNNRSTRSSVGL